MSTSLMLRHTVLVTGVTGSPYVSTTWFDTDTATPSLAVSAVESMWNDLVPFMSDSATVSGLDGFEVVDPVSGQLTGVIAANPFVLSGLSPLAAMAPATQGLIRLRTGVYLNGREVRGRIYVPALTEEARDDFGAPSSSFFAALGVAYDSLQPDGVGGVVWSRVNGEHERVLNADGWNQFAVLRSRRD